MNAAERTSPMAGDWKGVARPGAGSLAGSSVERLRRHQYSFAQCVSVPQHRTSSDNVTGLLENREAACMPPISCDSYRTSFDAAW